MGWTDLTGSMEQDCLCECVSVSVSVSVSREGGASAGMGVLFPVEAASAHDLGATLPPARNSSTKFHPSALEL